MNMTLTEVIGLTVIVIAGIALIHREIQHIRRMRIFSDERKTIGLRKRGNIQ